LAVAPIRRCFAASAAFSRAIPHPAGRQSRITDFAVAGKRQTRIGGTSIALSVYFFVRTIKVMIIYDETKRQSNLVKHGLDLADAGLVYDAPNKITLCSPRQDEDRLMDVAMVEVVGVVLVLVYVERGQDVRAILLRRASKQERKRYASLQQD
jgi:uncharacterized DUF497 family protein